MRLARVVFLGREQGFQLVAEDLPAGVLVTAGDRIGKQRQGHRPEAAEAGEDLPLVGGGRSLLPLDALSVRIAAMMSRALAFSPLAMADRRGGRRFLP